MDWLDYLVYQMGKKISFCNGYFACLKTDSCAIQDNAVEIVQKMHDAEAESTVQLALRWTDWKSKVNR